MNKQMPRTLFSTPLSGSARETELRLKNIFSGPKKRPPALFLALVFSVCIFCGNLVSCHVAEAPDNFDPEAWALALASGYSPQSEEDLSLLLALFQAADGEVPFQLPKARLLTLVEGDGCILGAAFVEDHLENTLLLGVMDTETQDLTGPLFRCTVHNGVPNVVTFRNDEDEDCLLYTFNGQENGQYTGEAGVVRFDGESMVWTWPVEGDIRYLDSSAQQEYQNYWTSHLSLTAPGGVDIYAVNPDFEWGKEEPASMWELETDELFYWDSNSAAELPMPICFQSLNWLIGYTADPGGWRITSLALNEERCDSEAQTDCFTLTACTDNGADQLTADLFFRYETEPSRPRIYNSLVHAEVREKEVLP